MKVLLIEPPPPSVGMAAIAPAGTRVFSPPWLLLCLGAYLRERTRFECHFTDARLYSHLEPELIAAVKLTQADVAVVHANPATTGEAAAVLDILKRYFPSLVTVVCGPFSSQFAVGTPDLARADYALAGDPEPILRDLLEYYGLPRKLLRVPGLMSRWMPQGREPAWTNDLKSLSLPDWSAVAWPVYAGPDQRVRVAARLSRGHSRLPADRAFGERDQPLRFWPMERLAASIQKSTAHDISEVFLDDPPGIWTPQRLADWCQTLIRTRNTQNWSLRLLPTHLSDSTIELLARSCCTRVEVLYPAVAPPYLERYGCHIKARDLRATLHALDALGIRVNLRFWLAGPESPPDEVEGILAILRSLDYPAAAFEIHPFIPDSPLAAEHPEARKILAEWIEWLTDPWIHPRPQLAWNSSDSAALLTESVRRIEKSIRYDPMRRLRHFWNRLAGHNWIEHWENRAAEIWTAVNVSRDLDQRSK